MELARNYPKLKFIETLALVTSVALGALGLGYQPNAFYTDFDPEKINKLDAHALSLLRSALTKSGVSTSNITTYMN